MLDLLSKAAQALSVQRDLGGTGAVLVQAPQQPSAAASKAGAGQATMGAEVPPIQEAKSGAPANACLLCRWPHVEPIGRERAGVGMVQGLRCH